MQFDSLGYTFRTGRVKSGKLNRLFVGFTPAVGKKALTAIRQKTRRLNYRNRTELSLPRHFVAGGVLWKILPVGDVSGL